MQTASRNGWFWYIPLHNNIVSVGVVAPFDYLFKNRDNPSNYEQTYNEEVDQAIAVKERVAAGRRVAGYFATKDYSYRAKQVAGNGWVLVGDAWGFLDPLYSSGVLLALRSGEMAADAIVEGLKSGDTRPQLVGTGVQPGRRPDARWSASITKASFESSFASIPSCGTLSPIFRSATCLPAAWTRCKRRWTSVYSGLKAADTSVERRPASAAPQKANELKLPDGWKPS